MEGFSAKINKLSNTVLAQINENDLKAFKKRFLLKNFDLGKKINYQNKL